MTKKTKFKRAVSRLLKRVPKIRYTRPRIVPVWVTRSGQRIRIPDLDSQHLDNIVNFLIRQAPRQQALEIGQMLMDVPDDAVDVAVEEALELGDLTPEEYARSKHPAVFAEWDKRVKRGDLILPKMTFFDESIDYGMSDYRS